MIVYEWTIEGILPDGDIEEVEHAESYREALQIADAMDYSKTRICLVRDSGPRLENREWGYVRDNQLTTFEESDGIPTETKIPNRYINEVERAHA